jgi:hypothetical protein
MLTRTSPSRRTRLLASAGVVLIAAGAGIAAWAAQPEQVVVQAQFQQPAPPAPPAPRAPLPPRGSLAPIPAPEAPQAPEAPAVPSARGFASVPEVPPVPAPTQGFRSVPAAPEAPPTPSARNRLAAAPLPPTVPAPLATPPVPPAPAAAPAPQQLSQAERDELMRRLEAQQREMEERLRQIERQRGELELQRRLLEVERQKLRSVAPQPTGDLKFDLPKTKLDEPAVKKILEEAFRYKEAAARAPAKEEFAVRKPDGTLRDKIVLGQVAKSFPFDSEIARARAAAELRKVEQAAREKQKPE